VAAIVGKDLRAFARDRLWIVLTPLSMAFVVFFFWILPDTVNDTVTVGLYPPASAELLAALEDEDETDAVVVVTFDREDRLVAAVAGELEDGTEEERDVSVGIAFPEDFVAAINAGKPSTVSVYVNAAVPPELRRAIASEVREVGYGLQASLAGRDPALALPIVLPDEEVIVLGEDRAGHLVPMREKLRPMMAILILMLEVLALAGLVSVEIEQQTVRALLVTPATTGDVLVAKGITGAILGVSQALVFLLLTRSFGDHWLLVTALMVLGALMMSAVGMIAGAAGKDFMSTLFLGVALITPLMIPAFAVLFPGGASLWVKILPSYGLVEAMVKVVGYGHGAGAVGVHVATTSVWAVALFGVALLVLKRRVEAL
jgi:ABC-2 type transport system permease protein